MQTEHTDKLIKIMRDGKPTKSRLLTEAFKLFALKPYDRVTFADLEEATGLSRGAILYHVKTKENLFLDVVKNFILDRNSVCAVPEQFRNNLNLFLSNFIELCRKEKEDMNKIGIVNVNNAMLNIEISAFFTIPEMRSLAQKWYQKEKDVWRTVLKNAIHNNEIRNNINIEIFTELFENIYLGTSFSGITYQEGYDINNLEEKFTQLYDLIKL